MIFQTKNECSLEAHRFQSLCALSFFLKFIIIMRVQDKNTKNSIKSKNHHTSKTLRDFKTLYIDGRIYCYKAKCIMNWTEENIRKDFCIVRSMSFGRVLFQ